MRNGFLSLLVFLSIVTTATLFSAPAVAQVFYPTDAANGRTQPSDAQKKAVEESKASLKYDPRDLSGIWVVAGARARYGGHSASSYDGMGPSAVRCA